MKNFDKTINNKQKIGRRMSSICIIIWNVKEYQFQCTKGDMIYFLCTWIEKYTCEHIPIFYLWNKS